MNKKEKSSIFEAITYMSNLFSGKVDSKRINAYVKILEDYNYQEVRGALAKCCTECEYFPSVATIIKMLDPPEDLQTSSNEMAGIIIESIRQYGSYGVKQASESLGPIPWRVVEQFGGWSMLCNTQISEMGIVRAQLRDLCRAILHRKKDLHLPQKNLLPHQKREMLKLSNILHQSSKELLG